MDFLHKAIELETETITAYRVLSSRCISHEGVHSILEMLINDHEQHLKTLRMAGEKNVFALDAPDVFKAVRERLDRIRSDKDTFSCDMDQLNLYREARDLVQEKYALYRMAREGLRDPEAMAYLDKLISEEHKQKVVLDNIIQMVERPESWLEDAEFSHLEDY